MTQYRLFFHGFTAKAGTARQNKTQTAVGGILTRQDDVLRL